MPSILVVDDDQLAAESFTTLLRHFGYHASFATTCRAAMDSLSGGVPDLVILDVMMPEVNGVELLKRIRTNRDMASVPVVIYSALDDDEWRVKAKDAGAHDYWIKGGLGFGELEEKVRMQLMA